MEKYLKPGTTSYSFKELQEIIGPAQAQSVELQIYIEQIQAHLTNKTSEVVRVAKIEKPVIYKLNKIA